MNDIHKLYESLCELKVRIAKLEEHKRLQEDENREVNQCIFDLNGFRHAQIPHNNIVDERLKIFNDHRKKQIDENRAVSRHLTNLDEDIVKVTESVNEFVETNFNNLNERLKKLEQSKVDDVPITFSLMGERIEKLEQMNEQVIKANPIKDIYERFDVLHKHRCKQELLNGAIYDHIHDFEKELKELENKLNVLLLQIKAIEFGMGMNTCEAFHTINAPNEPKNTDLTTEEAISALRRGSRVKRKNNHYIYELKNLDKDADLIATDWEIME